MIPDKALEDWLRGLMDLDLDAEDDSGQYAPTWVWVLGAIALILLIIILAQRVF